MERNTPKPSCVAPALLQGGRPGLLYTPLHTDGSNGRAWKQGILGGLLQFAFWASNGTMPVWFRFAVTSFPRRDSRMGGTDSRRGLLQERLAEGSLAPAGQAGRQQHSAAATAGIPHAPCVQLRKWGKACSSRSAGRAQPGPQSRDRNEMGHRPSPLPLTEWTSDRARVPRLDMGLTTHRERLRHHGQPWVSGYGAAPMAGRARFARPGIVVRVWQGEADSIPDRGTRLSLQDGP